MIVLNTISTQGVLTGLGMTKKNIRIVNKLKGCGDCGIVGVGINSMTSNLEKLTIQNNPIKRKTIKFL